ncbi:MAG: hypothetical protein AB7E96_07875 [Deferribacterales bacterium]
MLFIPGLGMLTGLGDSPESFRKHENRNKNRLEPVSPDKMPENITSWFRDSYGFRSVMIRQYSGLMKKLVPVNNSDKCILGKEGRLFLGNSDEAVIDGLQNKIYFDSNDINNLVRRFSEREKLAKDIGADYFVIFAPNKHSVYPEFLPDYISQGIQDKANLFDDAAEALIANGISVTNMKPVFRNEYAKEHDILYHKTDTHWSALGAYFGYERLMRNIRSGHPEIKAMEKPVFKKASNKEGYDLVDVCGFQGQEQDDFKMNYSLVMNNITTTESLLDNKVQVFENPNALNGMTVMIMRDSFGLGLRPYLLYTFKKLVFVHHVAETKPGADYKSLTLKYKPDIVIDEYVERMVNSMLYEEQ